MKKSILLLLAVLSFALVAQAQVKTKTAVSESYRVKAFSLDGKWELTGYSPDKFNHYKLEGTVPGQVHPDLQQAGIIPDPFWRNNAEQCQWPEKWQWTYKKVFDVPETFRQDWTVIQFDGLDTYSDIFLNGRKLGSTNNMFLPYEYGVKGILKEKGNVLEVIFHSPTEIEKVKNEKKQYRAAYESSRVYTRRMQCTYGWDWVHRFVTMGIWKSCRLVSYPDARIDDLFVYTESIEEKKAKLKLEFSSTIKDDEARRAKLTIADPDNKVVWEKSFSVNDPLLKFDADISKPQLWWPNGAGEQPLYDVTAILYDDQNNEIQRKTVETGIRTASIEQIPDATGMGSSFTILINGKRIFGKGGNWVPADPFPSRVSAEHYTKILRQAKDAGMNVLRVWGGGIYEPEAFWQACNKMGIMITQDFMLACAEYPTTDPGFVESLKKEFTENIRLVRNNPSLIYWAGDNELGLGFKPTENWWCKEMHQSMTAPLLQSMDPSREFRLTSPLGRDSTTTNSLISGDCHLGAQFNYDVINGGIDSLLLYRKFIKKITGRYMSESVAGGIPPQRTLLKFMNEEDLENNYMIDFHMHDPASRGMHKVAFIELFEMQSRALFGDPGDDNDRRLRQLEYVQYEFIRLTMESARKRKFNSSGVQFWMFNDCWPAATWSMTDYWGGRKAGWYGMAAGCRPVIAASDVEDGKIKWSVCNDMLEDVKAKLVVRVQPVSGEARFKKEIRINVEENTSVVAIELDLEEMKKLLKKDAVLVCDLSYGQDGFDRATWVPDMPQDVKYEQTRLDVSRKRSADSGEVTISTENWARVVTLDADVDFEDNYFEMLPGESRTIKWKAREKGFAGKINVTCWNGWDEINNSSSDQHINGLYVENGTLMKDHQAYYGIGANYYDLFNRSINDLSDTSHVIGLTRLAEAGIPFVRFSAGGFWPNDWKLYLDDKEKYFELFDNLVALAEDLGIGLIPSLFWHFQAIADLNEEHMDQFMNDQSKTIGFIKQYTGELVQRYNNSPALWGWEFGNEFSLFIDIPPVGGAIPKVNTALGTASSRDSVRDVIVSGCMYNAYDEFAKTVREFDQVRAIFTGGSEPRAWAFNNAVGNPWVKDSEDQTRAMLQRYNPDPINTLTIRGYWNLKNSFDNIAKNEYTPANSHANEIMGLSFAEYLPYAMKWSEEIGKPLFIGEWGASEEWLKEGKTWNKADVKDAFTERLNAIVENRVPLSAFWVYDLKFQRGTWNITFDNSRAYMIDMVSEANEKLNEIIEEHE